MRPDIKPPSKNSNRTNSGRSGSMMSVDDEEGVNLSMKMSLGSEKEDESSTLMEE